MIEQPAAIGRRDYFATLSIDLFDAQGQMLDEMISFVFDTLNARSLDLRVVPAGDLRAAIDA